MVNWREAAIRAEMAAITRAHPRKVLPSLREKATTAAMPKVKGKNSYRGSKMK